MGWRPGAAGTVLVTPGLHCLLACVLALLVMCGIYERGSCAKRGVGGQFPCLLFEKARREKEGMDGQDQFYSHGLIRASPGN